MPTCNTASTAFCYRRASAGFGQELDTRFADRVTLLTGALPAQYGYRTAGVVDIHTKNGGQENGGEASMYGR